MKSFLCSLVVALSLSATARAVETPIFSTEIVVDQERLPFYKKVDPTATVLPRYHVNDARSGMQGKVEVGVVVQPDGSVSGTFLKSGEASDTMKRTALSVVKQWKFPVIAADGKPIKYAASTTILFRATMAFSTANLGDMSARFVAWSEIEK